MSETHIQVCSPPPMNPSVPSPSRVPPTSRHVQRGPVRHKWSGQRSLEERCQVLRQVKNVIIERTDDICDLLSKEQGKPKIEAMVHEVANLVDLIHYFTSEADRILAPEPIPLHLLKHRASYLHWAPRGVVGIIGP